MGDSARRSPALATARVLWLIAAPIAAGAGHVAVLKTDILRPLAVPIDGERRWGGQPLLGANKTWRGVVVMTVLSAAVAQAQVLAVRRTRSAILGSVREFRAPAWIAGAALGAGYCLAELPNSFCKRRLGIPPGARARRGWGPQYLADQLDSVLGCLLVLRLLYRPRRGEGLLAFALGAGIHILIDQSLYLLGVKHREPSS